MSYTYDAWGNFVETVSASGVNSTALSNPFRYRGYYYDTDLGLYYLNARYYDSNTCRFINADGYVSTGQGLIGNNMYAYCNNNPVMYTDPTGEMLWWARVIIALVVMPTPNSVYSAVMNGIRVNDSEKFVEEHDDIEPMTDEEYAKYDEDEETHNGMTDEQRLAYIRRVRNEKTEVAKNWTEAEMLEEMRYHEKAYKYSTFFGSDPNKDDSVADRTSHTDFEKEQSLKTYIFRYIGNALVTKK